MKKNYLQDISQQTIKRYSDRYRNMGKDVKTLGWGSQEQQQYRFAKILDIVDCKNKTILDIGCGFGDFFEFIISRNIRPHFYTGWDINKDLIFEAKNSFNDDFLDFKVENLLETKNNYSADIVIMLGLLNFNLKKTFNNIDYSKKMITKAFTHCKSKLVVDFLSSNLSKDYPKEDFVFYHHPSEMLDFAFELTSNVSLFHNYKAIPQKEFILVLEK